MNSSRKKRAIREKQRRRYLLQDRARRIRLLQEKGMIKDAREIPEDAIPVDPYTSTKAGTWSPETFYRDIEVTCIDCGASECWTALSQQHYFEVMKASPYKLAKRCYACRQRELQRKEQARRESGHLR